MEQTSQARRDRFRPKQPRPLCISLKGPQTAGAIAGASVLRSNARAHSDLNPRCAESRERGGKGVDGTYDHNAKTRPQTDTVFDTARDFFLTP